MYEINNDGLEQRYRGLTSESKKKVESLLPISADVIQKVW